MIIGMMILVINCLFIFSFLGLAIMSGDSSVFFGTACITINISVTAFTDRHWQCGYR